MPAKIEPHIRVHCTTRHQGTEQIREEHRQDLLTFGQQSMDVIALWHALARLWTQRDMVAFDERDALKVIGKYARCQQSGQTSAYDDRVRVRA
jgi:hypothetical protein